jgi:hypothetical protein
MNPNGVAVPGGNGGVGSQSDITGNMMFYGGGGGGGGVGSGGPMNSLTAPDRVDGVAGQGGGGNFDASGTNGLGGGGGGTRNPGNSGIIPSGGNGVIIIRYKTLL